MSERKLMIYPRNSSRPIMLTDNNTDDILEMVDSLKNIFKSNNIFTISTSDDILMGKPSEVGFIQIRSKGECKNIIIDRESIEIQLDDQSNNKTLISNENVNPYDELVITDDWTIY